MPEELKKMFEESLKKAKKEMTSGMTSDFLDSIKLAMVSQKISKTIKDDVIEASKFFIEKNNLPKEEFLNYVIYGAVSSTVRILWDVDDESDNENDCECDCCHCPKEPSSDNGSAKEEFESSDSDLDENAALIAINALKAILSNNRG